MVGVATVRVTIFTLGLNAGEQVEKLFAKLCVEDEINEEFDGIVDQLNVVSHRKPKDAVFRRVFDVRDCYYVQAQTNVK